MILSVLQTVVGLVGLVAAGNVVVSAASGLGRRSGLPPGVVGLVIVSAGTSAPELGVVAQAVAQGDDALAVGGVIGSNIANVLLVLGISACLGSITVASRVVRTDIPVMILASVTMLLLALDGAIGRLDGVLLLVGLAAFVLHQVHETRSGATPADGVDPPGGDAAAGDGHAGAESSVVVLTFRLVAGATLLAVAARIVVGGAEAIALAVGVSDLVIGLTVVALGTSAPEIVTSIAAAARGERELAVGNAVGSNIFNVLFVLGAPAVVAGGGITVSLDALGLDVPVMLAAAVACLPLFAYDQTLQRWEGAMFLAFYAAYLAFLVLDTTGHQAAESFGVVMTAVVLPLTVVTLATVVLRRRRRRASRSSG